jgi:prophage regulatory protein
VTEPRTILRRRQVEDETGYSRASIYSLISRGLWTRGVSIGDRAVGWPADEVAALNAARIAGLSEDEIRALVAHLEDDRRKLAAEIKGGLLFSKRTPLSAGETRKALASGAPAAATAPATNGAQP